MEEKTGNDLIEDEKEGFTVLSPSDFMIFGGEDSIDVLLSKEEASLVKLLGNIKKSETPMVFNYDLLLSGDIDSIRGFEDLRRIGIKVDAEKRCASLSPEWDFIGASRSGNFSSERFARDGYILESILPVRRRRSARLGKLLLIL